MNWPRQSGMTVIEVILATTIAVLLLGLVFSIYHVVILTTGRQQSSRIARERALNVLDLISRDLTCSLIPSDNQEAFRLSRDPANPDASSVLRLYTAVTRDREMDLRRYATHRVTYSLRNVEVHGDAGMLSLVREFQPLSGTRQPDTLGEDILLPGLIVKFQVSVLGASQWVESWPPQGQRGLPRAALIKLTFQQGGLTNLLQSEVFIPVGQHLRATPSRN